jgi:hypothetical protein
VSVRNRRKDFFFEKKKQKTLRIEARAGRAIFGASFQLRTFLLRSS